MDSSSTTNLGKSSGPVIGLSAIFFGFALLIPSIFYAYAFLRVLPYTEQLEQISIPYATPIDIYALSQTWQSAYSLFPDPRLGRALGLIRLEELRQNSNASIKEWQNIMVFYQQLTARAPQNPFDWGRLSYAADHAHRTDIALNALENSFKTGRYLPSFMLWRYTHALTLLPLMSPEQKDQMGDQTGLLYKKKKWDLIRMARLAPFSDTIEQLITLYQPENRNEFLKKRGALKHNVSQESPNAQ